MLGSLMKVTTVRTTRISAAADRPADLEAGVAVDLGGDGALLGPELLDRVDQRALDDDEHDRRDVEHDLVQRVDLVGVRRAARLGGDEVGQRCGRERPASATPRRARAPPTRRRRGRSAAAGRGTGWRRGRRVARRAAFYRQGRRDASPSALWPRAAARSVAPGVGAGPAVTAMAPPAGLYWPPLACAEAHPSGAWAVVVAGVAAPADAPPRQAPPGRRDGRRRARAAGSGGRHAAPGRARDLARLRAEHVGLPRGLRAAPRRSRAPGRASRVDYPIAVDRVLGLGVPPTLRLQRGSPPRADQPLRTGPRLLPLGVVHGPARQRRLCPPAAPRALRAAAARMYAVFDIGAVFYWAIPTAPPWYAGQHGRLGGGDAPRCGG